MPIALKGDGAQALGELPAGAPLAFDVVIVNRAVGHTFPGGARDLRDTFLEVEVRGLERLTQARGLIPPHAGLDNLEGQALARVWRWPEAQAAFSAGSALAPRHDGLWRSLAGSAGSAGDRVAALEAAQAGLALEPRDGDLLRSQMLALEQRAPGSAEAKLARELYLRYRVDDLAPEVRGRCSDASPDCLRERLPVHVHGLRAPLGGDSGE